MTHLPLQTLDPERKGAGRPLKLDLRMVLNAILYVVVTGCQWRNLPREYPPAASGRPQR
jgi:transposase